MRLKIITISVLCCIVQSCNNNNITEENNRINNWTKIESGVSEKLYDVDFIDSQHGWIVGDAGIILHTENGGDSWERQTCLTEDLLWTVDFVDNKNGWICSRNSILKTTNGGENWDIKYNEDLGEGSFRDIQFLNKDIGFVVGGKGHFGSIGVLNKTEDGGETWQQVSLNSLPTLTKISIANEQNIWICGFGGTILSTKDIGITWTKKNLNISPSPSLTTIQFVDQYNGWVSSRDDWLGFFRTTDGGNTWIRRSEESLWILGVQTFFFIDSLNGWLGTFPGGDDYAITKTTDGGQTWKFVETLGAARIHSLCFLSKELGWAVGLDGVILKYTN